jgi:2-polyprenyl-6-methoxyphenol hydroxylase-like FAD-dependent oxidoreductase
VGQVIHIINVTLIDVRIQAAAALFLSHLNANIVVLESRPGRMTSTEGGVVMLGPNGMHVLQGLGLAEAFHRRPNGIEAPWLHMYESSGRRLGEVPQGSAERYGFASTMITRWDIQEVLLDAMEKKRLTIEWDAKVEDAEELTDGVIVRWRRESIVKERKVDLLIGADGIWSIVRTKCAIDSCNSWVYLTDHYEGCMPP